MTAAPEPLLALLCHPWSTLDRLLTVLLKYRAPRPSPPITLHPQAPTGGSGGNAASPSAAGESGDEAAQSSPVTHAVAPRPRRTSRPGSNLAALRKALPQSKDSPAEVRQWWRFLW